MLVKLLKHELIDYFKKTRLIFIIVFGISFLILGLNYLENQIDFIKYIKATILISYVFVVIGMFIYTLFYPIIRYYKSMLKDEAYLTHTLPVKVSQILLAKLLAAFILFFSSIIIFMVSLLITKTITWNFIKAFLTLFNKSIWKALIMILFYALIYYFSFLMMILTSLTIGHSNSSKKGIYSFVVGIIIYFIQQIFGAISLFIIVVFYPNILKQMEIGGFPLSPIMLIPSIVSMCLIIIEIITTHYFIKNKLNLEWVWKKYF